MDEIKRVIEELGINAFENNIKIAGIGLLSNLGDIVFQTENWDLNNQTSNIMSAINGDKLINLNNITFSVVESTSEGIIGTSKSGLGHIIIVPFQEGVLVSYALPQADPPRVLAFLKNYAMQLNGKV